MQDKWNYSSNNIVVRYPPLAGGKFFICMLSYFQNFMYPAPFVPRKDIQLDTSDIVELGNFCHNLKLNTIPYPENKKLWQFFEPVIGRFWNFNLTRITRHNHWDQPKISLEETYDLIPAYTEKCLKILFCFHIIHDSTYQELMEILPNCTIINLTDYESVQVASEFKGHTGSNRNIGQIESPNVINFSMRNVFDAEKFINDLSELSLNISGNAVFDQRIHEYYQRYLEIHMHAK